MGVLEGILYMLWRGIAIGIIISAPMGPVGILCIQRTLAKGRRVGFYTGVGAAISDLFYCLITGFGLSFIEDFLQENQNIIQIVGSVVLIGFAVYLFKSNPSRSIKKPEEESGASIPRNILNGFLFTVSNPLIIFLIIGLTARFNFMLPEIQIGHYIIGYICIMAGALGWWWMVTFFVDKVRAHFNLRSMWMINKFTGTIIAIFGIVGIITGITGIARAAAPNITYLNSTRGFGPWSEHCDRAMSIDGNDSTAERSLELSSSEFDWRMRVRNLHNETAHRYPTGNHGTKRRVSHPGWRLMAIAPDDTVTFAVRTIDDYRDPLGPTALAVSVYRNDSLLEETGFRDYLDWSTGWNAFSLRKKGDMLSLRGGERSLHPLFKIQVNDFEPTAVAIAADPAALLEVDWVELRQPQNLTADMAWLANPDSLNNYLAHSPNPMEGIWEVCERSLDEEMISMGGNYRVAIVDNGSEYEMLYLSGAVKNPGRWKRGVLKGRLAPSAFDNIYDVTWIGADGQPVDTEIKAQYQAPSELTLQFPYQNSTLTLQRVD